MADLLVLKFDSVYGAQQALVGVRALEALEYAWVDDVAVIEKHKHGHVSIHSPHGSSSGGAWMGAFVGMLVFFWFPPAWFLLGAVGGAGIGAGIGELLKHAGLDESLTERVKGMLTNGTSALIMIGIQGDVDQMVHAFDLYKPVDALREALPDKTVVDLQAKLSGDPQ
jgi:uncharacterized membrane protein